MIQRLLAVFTVLAFGTACAQAADKIDFEKQIEPVFTAHCVKCHGETKALGKMRLDTVAGLQAKLAAKPQLLVAGKPDESELYRRLTLPAGSAKRMPKGADPLAKDAIDLIATWIKQGAVLPAAAKISHSGTPAAKAQTAEKLPEMPVLPEVAAAPQAAIDKLVAAGARVTPLYAGSNLLDVSFAGRGEPAGDAEVALLAGVADQVYTLNLADAKISATGVAPLAALKNLCWLHLERAGISDDCLAPVGRLAQLQYLNLYGTPITDAGLKHLSELKHLQKLYLWQTKVSFATATSLEHDIPGLIVNLGFDHPEVARQRLTKELASQKQADVAKAEMAKVEQRLKDAQKEAEAAAAQVSDVEKELKALESPAHGS